VKWQELYERRRSRTVLGEAEGEIPLVYSTARFIQWLTSTRRLVETVIGQLTERFHIEKVRARKFWYLTNRIARKVLAHTVCVFINIKNGTPTLQFELLIKP
jgi:hypothetical protein